jgi:hypothetical protein
MKIKQHNLLYAELLLRYAYSDRQDSQPSNYKIRSTVTR